ncbi:MAG TPA: tRNA dihydrouridine(20/20a) synthase DusA [Betaproteobacteria bacterium]|mgnify:FL=1|jgi:tRNA-dihydrouridine synthase A|nr:tRNA dihydrouridine(20/20a) synthase DusA [Burkholderiales bacterium]HBZ18935.1 tRNA dihydrouridine(20/20a) synthase DusA [Betaproteobacteria bacterium]
MSKAFEDPHRLCTAPMLDWSDRHCRFVFRIFAPHAMLYTEMVTTGAIIHGDQRRHLDFSEEEHPLALQLGGSAPEELQHCAMLASSWGYDEINLNCGCPSERVQKGNFGASLMFEHKLVAQCVQSMRDATNIPITVKHRLGVDDSDSYDFVSQFVGTVRDAGCKTFIVHARIAVLKGLSPKKNREVPPLNYEFVYRLKQEYPDCAFIINGGLDEHAEFESILEKVNGVMIGRAIYHSPEFLGKLSQSIHGSTPQSLDNIILRIHEYVVNQVRNGVPLKSVTRHLLGLFHGRKGARMWRRILSDPDHLKDNDPDLIMRAYQEVC